MAAHITAFRGAGPESSIVAIGLNPSVNELVTTKGQGPPRFIPGLELALDELSGHHHRLTKIDELPDDAQAARPDIPISVMYQVEPPINTIDQRGEERLGRLCLGFGNTVVGHDTVHFRVTGPDGTYMRG